MKIMICSILSLLLAPCLASNTRPIAGSVSVTRPSQRAGDFQKLTSSDILWIQKVLDNWSYACLNELKIKIKPLPWIIFYDSTSAWHLNADTKLLPPFEKTRDNVIFAGFNYQLIRLAHKENIWVPDRNPIPLTSLPATTIPYADNRKVLFVAPLQSLFHKLGPPDQSLILDFLFLGVNIHELTHTRQLPYVLPQLLKIDKADKRESLDDNTVENEFSKNERYKSLYFKESEQLWNAFYLNNDDSCRAAITRSLQIAEIRKHEFFSGNNHGLGQADEIFLALEGSAMWTQYQIMFKNAPNPNERDLLSWIVQQGPAWSQERGLVLFLLIDRFDSHWQEHFFECELPAATGYLRSAMAIRK